MKKNIYTIVVFLSMSFVCMHLNAQTNKQIFPRGVYWPWERTARNARANKMDTWQYTDKLMGMLKKDYNCNLIWIIHLPGKDNKRFCDLAQKHGLKIVMNNPMQDLSVWGFEKSQTIKAKAKKAVKQAGDLPAYYAYTLKDEPKRSEVRQLDEYYQALSHLDKTRPIVPVIEIKHIEAYFRKSKMKILCSDPYGFGGKNSPYLPATPLKAQDYFRNSAVAIKRLAAETGKDFWMMPQAFAEIWGRFYANKNADIMLLPGTYLHWRMPEVSEIRWQFWESLRNGSKGIIYFVLLPAARGWTPSQGAAPKYMLEKEKQSKAKKLPVAKTLIDTKTSDGLIKENFKPTVQFTELAKLYGKIKAYENVLAAGNLTSTQLVFTNEPFACGSFHSNEKYYCVIVNNSLKSEISQNIFFPSNVSSVYDPINKKDYKLVPGSNALKCSKLKLQAGDGTILEVKLAKNEATSLFVEDFSLKPLGLKTENIDVRYHSNGWGIPQFQVASPKSVPAFIKINNLVMSKPAQVTVTGGFPKKDGDVYLKINGKLNGITINILDKSKKIIKSKNDKFYIPLLLPPKAYEIIIKIDAKDTFIEDIKIWTSPK